VGESTANVRQVFERCGLRCTRQRELIYAALVCTREHPTAEELLGLVRSDDSGLSLATVYNTLEALTECRLVRRIPCPSGSGPCRFDAITSNHVHLALDGRLMDLPEDLSARLLEHVPASLLSELEERLGVRVAGVSIQITASADPAAGLTPQA
jgi:Fur family transcriptional regulator, peroxide stress response regulator